MCSLVRIGLLRRRETKGKGSNCRDERGFTQIKNEAKLVWLVLELINLQKVDIVPPDFTVAVSGWREAGAS